MWQHDAIAHQILNLVRLNPECTLEQLIQEMVEFHWSDIFFEVHKLSQSGRLQLTRSSSELKARLRVPDTGDRA